MAFTYDDTLTSTRDKVRFWIRDTVADKGPMPNNGNFSDDEINGLLTIEDSWQEAVAAGFETLAAAWASHTSFSVNNGSFSRSDATKHYLTMAKSWRERYGEATAAPTPRFSVRAVTRQDGYSDDLTAVET